MAGFIKLWALDGATDKTGWSVTNDEGIIKLTTFKLLNFKWKFKMILPYHYLLVHGLRAH